MTVTSDSACKSPAESSVWWSSTKNPPDRTFTLRILCSIGSSQTFFSWSIAFNSSMVFVGMTSTVRSPPSKVFTFSSRGMAAMAARKPSTRNRQGLGCVSKMWGALKSTASLLKCTIYNRFGGSLTWKHKWNAEEPRFKKILQDSSVFYANNCSQTWKKERFESHILLKTTKNSWWNVSPDMVIYSTNLDFDWSKLSNVQNPYDIPLYGLVDRDPYI